MEEYPMPKLIMKNSRTDKLSKLDVGQDTLWVGVTIKIASQAAFRASRTLKRKYRCRTEETGVRVYRVA